MGKWGIPEKNHKNVAQQCQLDACNSFLLYLIAKNNFGPFSLGYSRQKNVADSGSSGQKQKQKVFWNQREKIEHTNKWYKFESHTWCYKPLCALSSWKYVNFFYPQSWKDTAFVCNWRIDQLASESTSVTHRESFKRDYSCLDKKTQRTNQLGMEQAHKIEAFCIKIVKVALKHHSAIF